MNIERSEGRTPRERAEDERWEREDRLMELTKTVRALVKDGCEPADVLRFALTGMGPGTMQQGVPMVLGKALAAGLAACADFDFRDPEEIALEREAARSRVSDEVIEQKAKRAIYEYVNRAKTDH